MHKCITGSITSGVHRVELSANIKMRITLSTTSWCANSSCTVGISLHYCWSCMYLLLGYCYFVWDVIHFWNFYSSRFVIIIPPLISDVKIKLERCNSGKFQVWGCTDTLGLLGTEFHFHLTILIPLLWCHVKHDNSDNSVWSIWPKASPLCCAEVNQKQIYFAVLFPPFWTQFSAITPWVFKLWLNNWDCWIQ